MVAMKNFRVGGALDKVDLFPWINNTYPSASEKIESVSNDSVSLISEILNLSWAVSLDEAIAKIKEMTDSYNSDLKKIEDEEKEAMRIESQKKEEELKIANIFSDLENETYSLDLDSIPENNDEINNNKWLLKIIRTEKENKFDKYAWLFEDAA